MWGINIFLKNSGYNHAKAIHLYRGDGSCIWLIAFLCLDYFVVIDIVQSGFAGLGVLEGAGNSELPSIFDEMGAGLVKGEGDMSIAALTMQVKNPVKVERTAIFARLAPDRDFFNQNGIEIAPQVNSLKHGSDNDKPMADWKR